MRDQVNEVFNILKQSNALSQANSRMRRMIQTTRKLYKLIHTFLFWIKFWSFFQKPFECFEINRALVGKAIDINEFDRGGLVLNPNHVRSVIHRYFNTG